MRVTIQLPDDISAALEQQWDDVPRRSLEAIAVDAYRTGALTEPQVRRLLKRDTRFQVHALLKEHHVPLAIEANAQALIKRPDARAAYVLYLDGVLPEELAELLVAIGAEERKGKPADAQFEMAVVLKELIKRREIRPANPRPERVFRRAITETPRHNARVVLS